MRKKKSKKTKSSDIEIWTEEQYEEYLKGIYGMEYIAGFTENGVPYGLSKDEENNSDTVETFCNLTMNSLSNPQR